MAQHDYVIANGTGAAVRSDLNAGFAAIVSQNSGATAPSTTYAYQSWADTTAGVMKMRNGANNAWITLYQLDGEWSTIAFENGTAAAPSIYFKDSGTDTGIYSPGADQVGISTGGTVRLTTTTTGITSALPVDVPLGAVGTPSITFTGDTNTGIYSPGADQVAISTGGVQRINIEADGDINIEGGGVFYDATNNRLGIGTANPSNQFTVGSNGLSTITLDWIGDNLPKATFSANHSTGEVRMGATNNSGTYFTTLYSNNSEAVRIDGSQRMLVGTIASPAHQLQVSTDSAGKPSTNTWTIVSDERIKEEIELADLDLCYEAVKSIPLKRFKWKDQVYTEEQVRDRRKLGWIAQDVEAVFPKAVGTYEFKYNQVFEETIIPAVEEVLDGEGNVTTPAQPERIEQGDLISEDVIEDCRDLNSDQIYATMYGAIQKLMAKVETLEASNTELLARVTALEGA